MIKTQSINKPLYEMIFGEDWYTPDHDVYVSDTKENQLYGFYEDGMLVFRMCVRDGDDWYISSINWNKSEILGEWDARLYALITEGMSVRDALEFMEL